MSPLFRRRQVSVSLRQHHGRIKRSPRTRLLLQALEDRAVPAAFTVNLSGDTNAGGGGVSTGLGSGDLRWCYEQARVGGLDDTITYTSGINTTLTAALPTYTENAALTITGQGKNSTAIIAPASSRVFDFNVPGATPTITITDLKLQGGNVTTGYGGAIRDDNEVLVLTNVAFTANTAVAGGGALAFTATVASITITGCDFTSNTATTTTVSSTTGGGAIYFGGAATVKLDSSLFDGNRATSGSSIFAAGSFNLNSDSSTFKNGQSFGTTTNSGGALFLQNGASTVSINNATVTGNTTLKDGGFLYAFSTGTQITLQNSTFSSNSAGNRGGVLRTFSASTVTVTNCTFANNSATGVGGALNPGSQLIVTKSTFSGNSAGGIGGAIYGGSSSTTISTSIFSNNISTSTTGGGAVRIAAAATINFSQFTANISSGNGGAIMQTANTMTVNNSTFSKNLAALNGGAIASSGAGALIINQSTFNQNTASGSGANAGGGALVTTAGSGLTVNNSTIYENVAVGVATATGGGGILRSVGASSIPFNLISTIVSNNLLPNGTVGIDLYSSSSTTSIAGTKNLIGTNDLSSITFASPASNQIGTNASKINAKLGALVDNGGEAAKALPDGSFVKTMGLLVGSPALHQGLANGFSNDQRGAGFARDDGSGVDVGAFEGLATIPGAQLTSATPIISTGNASYTFDVTYTDDSGFDTTTFDLDDLTVTGAGFGAGQKATAINVSGSGKSYVVTYTIPAPPGGWGGINPSNVFNIGNYTITINPSQVSDDSANFVPSDAVGLFKTAFALALTVDQNSDIDDNNLSAGQLSFREALRVSNTNSGQVDSISFSSTTFNAASTITLTAGPRGISDSVVITGPTVSLTMNAGISNQQLAISSNQSVTISNLNFSGFSAASAGAVFAMNAATLTLSNTTLSNNTSTSGGGAVLSVLGASSVTINNSTISTNSASVSGGALRINAGSAATVTITNSTLSGNTSGSTGGALYASTLSSVTITNSTFSNNRATTGGAIRTNATTASITINGSTFSNNTTTSANGGAADLIGSVSITASTFTGNYATSSGGALYLGSLTTTATISRSIFANNTGASTVTGGGAIHATGATTLTISDSQFTTNTSAATGGAIRTAGGASLTLNNDSFRGNTAAGNGGALYHGATLTLTVNQNSFRGNTAAGNDGGGAIGHASTGAMVVNNSTIYGNTASGASVTSNGGGISRSSTGTLTLISTIVSNNTITGAGTGGVDLDSLNAVNLTAGAAHHNLIGNNDNSNVTFDDVTTNLLGNTATPIDAKLAPMADYGGALLLPDGSHVQTMPLLAGSPALDIGDANGFTNDQRGAGFPRVVNGGVANQADIGAAEGALLPPTVTSVVFGDGTSQRSLVRQMVVTFSESVTFMNNVVDAFTLTRTGTGGPTGNVTLTANPMTGPASQVTITFSGSLSEFGSLIDGFYDFIINAAEVSGGAGALDGNNDQIPGGSYTVIGNTTNKFFRMFGDADGSATTSLADFSAFRNAFNLGPNAIFDFDNDGNVGLADFAAFRQRFNLSP